MAFEFRDILPAVGAVLGFGFGGPGGAALGSGIGSLARGDEADEAFKNAALGYVGGQGVKYLGGTEAGKGFFSRIPGGNFLTGTEGSMGGIQGDDIFGAAFDKGKEMIGMGDPAIALEKNLLEQQEIFTKLDNLKGVDPELIKGAKQKLIDDMSSGASTEESLFNLKNILGLAGFSGIFGKILDKGDEGEDMSKYMVTTDTPLKGFDTPTKIKDVTEFAANGGLMSLAQGGFPRKNGKIQGPGTETSDDIPAMLSDGEFVVNARTVRGLGESMGGSGKMNARERGAEFLYGVQNQFGGKA